MGTTDDEQLAPFSAFFGGTIDSENNFGWINSNSLPVEWGEVSVDWQGENGLVRWSTLQEGQNHRFGIERSTDQRRFTEIGSVLTQGQNDEEQSYQLEDRQPTRLGAPRFYYRIKQIDLDGQFSYSPVVELTAQAEMMIQMELSPNPAQDQVNIRYWNARSTQIGCRVMATDGRIVFDQTQTGTSGLFSPPISRLPAGVYIVQLLTETESHPLLQQKLLIR